MSWRADLREAIRQYDPHERVRVVCAISKVERLSVDDRLRKALLAYATANPHVFVCPSWQHGLCDHHTYEFIAMAESHGVVVRARWLRVEERPEYRDRGGCPQHCVAVVADDAGELAIDWTPRQYDEALPIPYLFRLRR